MPETLRRHSPPNPFAAPVRLPLKNDDAYDIVASVVFELLNHGLEADLGRLGASAGMTLHDQAVLQQMMHTVRQQCVLSLIGSRGGRSRLAAETVDEREGTLDDPMLPILREMARESDKPLSISWLLRHLGISYRRGGRLVDILKAECESVSQPPEQERSDRAQPEVTRAVSADKRKGTAHGSRKPPPPG